MKSQSSAAPSAAGAEKNEYKVYQVISLLLSITFAIVGLVFLVMPDSVLTFFNSISLRLGMPASSTEGINFFLILAVGYMYLVTLLAFLMYRHPENRYFLWLLINAKTASSVLSICMYIFHQHFLIYLTNAIVDGSIAVILFLFYFRLRKMRYEYSSENN